MRARVLVVDTPRAAKLVAQLLDDEFELCCASSWAEALRCLHEERPQLVLVGYHFDEMRPYRFIRHLRDDALAHELPIVVVRGQPLAFGPPKDEAEVRESYRDFGADDYVSLDKGSTGEAFRQASAHLRGVVQALLQDRAARRAAA